MISIDTLLLNSKMMIDKFVNNLYNYIIYMLFSVLIIKHNNIEILTFRRCTERRLVYFCSHKIYWCKTSPYSKGHEGTQV